MKFRQWVAQTEVKKRSGSQIILCLTGRDKKFAFYSKLSRNPLKGFQSGRWEVMAQILRLLLQLCSGSGVEAGDRMKPVELITVNLKWPGLQERKWQRNGGGGDRGEM